MLKSRSDTLSMKPTTAVMLIAVTNTITKTLQLYKTDIFLVCVCISDVSLYPYSRISEIKRNEYTCPRVTFWQILNDFKLLY